MTNDFPDPQLMEPVHEIEQPTFFKIPETIFRMRVIYLIVMSPYLISSLFIYPDKFFNEFTFIGYWGEILVFSFFFRALYLRTIGEEKGRSLVNFQHALVALQAVIVALYWGVIHPVVGWGVKDDFKYFTSVRSVMFFRHTAPFAFILFDTLGTRGTFTSAGVKLGSGIYVLWAGVVTVLHLAFKITPYPTEYTDGESLKSVLTMITSCLGVIVVGFLFMKIKNGGSSGQRRPSGFSVPVKSQSDLTEIDETQNDSF